MSSRVSHAATARAFNQKKKENRHKKKALASIISDDTGIESGDSASSQFDESHTAELQDAGYLVFLGLSAQYWRYVLLENPLVDEKITSRVDDAKANFAEMGYDIADEDVELPGNPSELSQYAIFNLVR